MLYCTKTEHKNHQSFVPFLVSLYGKIYIYSITDGTNSINVKILLDGARIQRRHMACLAILLIGIIGPAVALDYLFYDEFFLFPVYACMAVRFLYSQYPAEGAMLYE